MQSTALLTNEDIKMLKYNSRFGFLTAFVLCMFLLFALFAYRYGAFGVANDIIVSYFYALIVLLFVSCAGIALLINKKILLDIKNGEKILELKKIQQKESNIDFEDGSPAGDIKEESNSYEKFALVIDNYRYKVDKTFFYSVKAGDEVYFHLAPLSRELLQMELKKERADSYY